MKAIHFERFGKAEEVLEVADVPDPPPPGRGEVVVRMEAAPVNPADLLLMLGKYGDQPSLPHIAGLEGVGRIEAVGPEVSEFEPGMLVMPLVESTWQERLRLKASDAVALPEGLDVEQAAMLKVNPATAELLLTSIVDLQAGEWVVQNAANSAVGGLIVQLARARGIRTVNIVRRESAVPSLQEAGADTVIVDAEHDPRTLVPRVREATGGAALRLGIDAVAGPATNALAATLAPGGTVVNYGGMSRQPCHVHPMDLIFRDLRVRGFWRTSWVRRADAGDIRRLYDRLAAMLAEGALHAPVAARYPVTQVREAVAHAAEERRAGKILLKW